MICVANKCNQDSRNCRTPWRCSGKYESEAHYTAMTSPVLCLNEHDSSAALIKDKRWSTAAKVMFIFGAVAVPAAGYQLWPIFAALWRLS